MFQTTRWTIVFRAAREQPGNNRPALTSIVEKYWKPLYAFARQQGLSESDAEDATQSFITQWIDGTLLEQADPAKGRFRTYLLTAWKRFLVDRHRYENREKRGGGKTHLSLDAHPLHEHHFKEVSRYGTDPDDVFSASWAASLVEEALSMVRAEYADSKRLATCELLIPYLTIAMDAKSYASIADRLGVSMGAAKVALHRLRHRFAEAIKSRVMETIEDPSEIDRELNELFQFLLTKPPL